VTSLPLINYAYKHFVISKGDLESTLAQKDCTQEMQFEQEEIAFLSNYFDLRHEK